MRTLPEGATRRAPLSPARRTRHHGGDGHRRRATRAPTLTGIGAVAGAILAGGSASRFGGIPKGLLTLDGVRLIDRVAAALRPLTTELLVVSGASDAPSWLPEARAVPDRLSARGAMVGVHAALSATAGAVLVVAWDMPFVSAELLQTLIDRADDSVQAVVPEGPDGLEPLTALYLPAALQEVERCIGAGVIRATAILAALPAMRVVPLKDVAAIGDPTRLFANVNAPADLAALASSDRHPL